MRYAWEIKYIIYRSSRIQHDAVQLNIMGVYAPDISKSKEDARVFHEVLQDELDAMTKQNTTIRWL